MTVIRAAAGEPADLRLVVPAGAAWAAAWLAAGWSPPAGLFAALLVLAVAVGVRVVATRPRARVVRVACLCAAGGFAATAWRVAAVERGPVPGLAAAHASVTLDLRVGSDPRRLVVTSAGGSARAIVVFDAEATSVEGADRPGRVSVRSPVFVIASGASWLPLQPSQRVRASGRLVPARPGEFESAVFDARGSPASVAAASLVERLAGRVRASLRDAAAPLPAGPGGLLPGLVDGDVSRLPPELVDDFTTTGLTHLVAVSGANLAVVLGALLAACRWLRAPPWLQALLGAALIAAFVVIARPQPSVLRAAAMGAVALAALATGRPYRRRALPALAASVLVLVCASPSLARSAGFALSVLATLSLLVVAPRLRWRLARRYPQRLADALAVPTAATLLCAPLIVSFAGRVSLAAVPANLLAEPAVGPATILGVLSACTAAWWPTGARLLAWAGGWFCTWIVFVARTLARVPAASVAWPAGRSGALALIAILALAACGWWLLVRAPVRPARELRDG